MNKDLIVGILVSLLLHGGFFGYEYLFPKGKVKAHTIKAEDPHLSQFEIPPEEPEKPDKVEELDEQPETVVAPPSLQDVPTVVPVNAFTTPITPPPPPGLPRDNNAVTIPVIKAGANFGKNIKDLFNPADLDQQVQIRVPVKPTYPTDLKRQGINGEVLVEFIVDSNGNVTDARIIRSSHREFEAPTLAAIVKWKFRPGKKGGKAVASRAQMPVLFTPTDD